MSNKNHTYWAILWAVISIGALWWLNAYLKVKQNQNLQQEIEKQEQIELIKTINETKEEVSKSLNTASRKITWDMRKVLKDNEELIEPLVKDKEENTEINQEKIKE